MALILGRNQEFFLVTAWRPRLQTSSRWRHRHFDTCPRFVSWILQPLRVSIMSREFYVPCTPYTYQSCTEPPSSWCSTNGSFRHSDSSLYPDSLNQETSSVTGTTRVEFIIGSPTRRFRQSSVWPHRYFDSIDSAAIPESLLTDEFSLRRGEALAECDSLECHPISNESWIAEMSFVVWPK